MKRAFPAIAAVVTGLLLGGCALEVPPGTESSTTEPPPAPPVPQNLRAHSQWQKTTGINGDAVAAVIGNAAQSYIYYDPIAANKTALAAAPTRLCASYGKQLASSYTTYPQDNEPGVKVLALTCK